MAGQVYGCASTGRSFTPCRYCFIAFYCLGAKNNACPLLNKGRDIAKRRSTLHIQTWANISLDPSGFQALWLLQKVWICPWWQPAASHRLGMASSLVNELKTISICKPLDFCTGTTHWILIHIETENWVLIICHTWTS